MEVLNQPITGLNIQDLITEEFGGGGGSPFLQTGIRTIALRHGKRVDAIIINGQQYGGDGGELTNTLTLAPDEYIARMEIRHGANIDRLVIVTNKNRIIQGGGDGGTLNTVEGIIVALGGRSGKLLDQLQVLGDFR